MLLTVSSAMVTSKKKNCAEKLAYSFFLAQIMIMWSNYLNIFALLSYFGIRPKDNIIGSFTLFQTRKSIPVMHASPIPNLQFLYVRHGVILTPIIVFLSLVHYFRSIYVCTVCMYAHLWTRETKTSYRSDLEHAPFPASGQSYN